MKKIDFKKELKHLYQASAKEVVQIDVPPANFLMVDGEGDPNTSQAYCDALEALYAVSYTVKFMVKRGALAIDYGVMPLEGLWWADDMSSFASADKSKWKWTMMIAQPPCVTRDIIQLESPRELRRLHSLRGLSHEEVNEVFPRSTRTRCTHGARAPWRVPIPVGSH